MSAESFVGSVLLNTLAAKHVVVGEDFHYGARRQGDIDSLRQSGEKLGFEVHAVPMIDVEACRASSSNIRACLANGDLEQAEQLLGRPYRMKRQGDQGASIGSPTRLPDG